LLDFDVDPTLGGVALTAAEIEALLRASAGLVLIKGRWVEVDPDKLAEVLVHWREVEARAVAGGVSFAEAMRLLATTPRSGWETGSSTRSKAASSSGWRRCASRSARARRRCWCSPSSA